MGGGLLQLASSGQIDNYLVGNPQISFYEYVFKRHTNFSMESRILDFISVNSNKLNRTSNTIKCKIGRHGDLLSKMYFCFTLPNVYSSDQYRFRWVENIGTIIMKKATITLNGSITIDELTGEWMNIWNELTTVHENFDTLIGNVPEINNPKISNDRVTIKNNQFIYYYYPESYKPNDINDQPKPSIPKREIIVPLNFWFTKTPALALPLLRMQLYEIELTIELEESEKLYQVFSHDILTYTSPIYYNEINSLSESNAISINNFLDDNYDLNPYIDAKYIFLENEERLRICYKPKITYLAEQVRYTTRTGIIQNERVEYNTNLPTKELVWVFRRDDIYNFNDFSNYSPTIPESKKGIMVDASINFYNNSRLERKPEQYFNMIQPYENHTVVPKNGIYTYAFSLYPEKEILTGYYNGALFKTDIHVWVDPTNYDNDLKKKFEKINVEYNNIVNYNMSLYAYCYNLFEIIGGQVNMKFAT